MWAIAAAIVILGAISFWEIGARSAEFTQRQISFLVIGTMAMIGVSLIDYRIFKNLAAASVIVYIMAVVLLFAALTSREIRGVSSWIILGGFTFAPSEFAKLAVLLLLAKYFSQKHVEIYNVSHIMASAIYVFLPAILTLSQPDLGSTTVFVILWLSVLIFSGIKRKHLLTIVMIGMIIVAGAWMFALKPYQKDRIVSYINPYIDPRGSGYNLLQSQITIGSGQIWGTFWKTKKPTPITVPEPYNDFAFAAFAKKFGFIGVVFLFIMLIFLVKRMCSIAIRAGNNFAKLFSLGFATIILAHTFINAGMNLGLLPITGIPFSFLSYGGSHLITLMIGLGIIQNIRVSSRP